MSEKRVYKALPELSRERINQAIENDEIEILIVAAFAVATYDLDWKYAQDLCIRLSNHPDKTVSTNAVRALGYVARVHGRLEKHLVKPILIRARRDSDPEVSEWAEETIMDINLYMNWHISHKRNE